MDCLLRAEGRGVKVEVHTRSPEVFSGKTAEYQLKHIKSMRDYGFEVVERKRMHEKAVIIDMEIA